LHADDPSKLVRRVVPRWIQNNAAQARLAAIAIILRKFPQSEEKRILKVWENVTFRIYGLGGRDARTKVGEYVRLAWRVSNENLSGDAIIDELTAIGQEFP